MSIFTYSGYRTVQQVKRWLTFVRCDASVWSWEIWLRMGAISHVGIPTREDPLGQRSLRPGAQYKVLGLVWFRRRQPREARHLTLDQLRDKVNADAREEFADAFREFSQ